MQHLFDMRRNLQFKKSSSRTARSLDSPLLHFLSRARLSFFFFSSTARAAFPSSQRGRSRKYKARARLALRFTIYKLLRVFSLYTHTHIHLGAREKSWPREKRLLSRAHTPSRLKEYTGKSNVARNCIAAFPQDWPNKGDIYMYISP